MENQQFDDLSRALASPGTRRSVVGGLVGVLGVGLLAIEGAVGESKHRRRRQRRRKRRARRQARRTLRAIKVIVANPRTSPQAIEVELGYSPVPFRCCQGQAGYVIQPGESRTYATEETAGYLWVENRYFISFRNIPLGPPVVSWAIDGASRQFIVDCCKPQGQTLGFARDIDEGETLGLNFQGRRISVTRIADEEDYKVFLVTL